jgi:hypothetical protein
MRAMEDGSFHDDVISRLFLWPGSESFGAAGDDGGNVADQHADAGDATAVHDAFILGPDGAHAGVAAQHAFHGAGTPYDDARHWHEQRGEASCAVVAQAAIYEAITGQALDEDRACSVAEQSGIFDPATGTRPEDMGKLLDVLGVPTTTVWNASVMDIADALSRGDKVLVGINANDVWSPVHDPVTGLPVAQQAAGHAVWVTGIETSATGEVRVVLNDSGTAHGSMESVPLLDFENAWRDFGRELVIATAPHGTS